MGINTCSVICKLCVNHTVEFEVNTQTKNCHQSLLKVDIVTFNSEHNSRHHLYGSNGCHSLVPNCDCIHSWTSYYFQFVVSSSVVHRFLKIFMITIMTAITHITHIRQYLTVMTKYTYARRHSYHAFTITIPLRNIRAYTMWSVTTLCVGK
jgi:DNA-binding CsgD family transcriptional regulator